MHVLPQSFVHDLKLTRVVAAPLLGGTVLPSHHAAEVDLVLGSISSSTALRGGQIGEEGGGGTAGDSQLEGGRAGGDAPPEVVHPRDGLGEVGRVVERHADTT